METSQSVSAIVSLLLTTLAAISLIVGGIGIRQAIGARRQNILIQFVMEALVVSASGGVIAIELGIVASLGVERLFQWNLPILPQGVALSFISSIVVGLASGVYPARKASLLEVVDALRFE